MNNEQRERMYQRYKKMFEPLYDISVCGADEIGAVQAFIDRYWKKGHTLVKSRALMDWQHRDPENGTYHFIVARSKKTGEIHAIEGFIPTSQFDPSIRTPMTWGAIWKTVEGVAPPGLGMVVKQYREHEYAGTYASEVGISSDAMTYSKSQGKQVYKLETWYMANPYVKEYHLIRRPSGEQRAEKAAASGSAVSLRRVGREEWAAAAAEAGEEKIPPFKSVQYYCGRYFDHPVYHYDAFLLRDKETGESEILMCRTAQAPEGKCVFAVDYIGDGKVLAKAGGTLRELLREEGAEYMLFLCSGMPSRIMEEAGFSMRERDGAVIPVYYEPFYPENVDIYCTTPHAEVTWRTFKGDADQDRPNVLD